MCRRLGVGQQCDMTAGGVSYCRRILGASPRRPAECMHCEDSGYNDGPEAVRAVARSRLDRDAALAEERHLLRHDFEGPHHLMVLMAEDVTVPDIQAGFLEEGLDFQHFADVVV